MGPVKGHSLLREHQASNFEIFKSFINVFYVKKYVNLIQKTLNQKN